MLHSVENNPFLVIKKNTILLGLNKSPNNAIKRCCMCTRKKNADTKNIIKLDMDKCVEQKHNTFINGYF